jgi:hypothetical protein
MWHGSPEASNSVALPPVGDRVPHSARSPTTQEVGTPQGGVDALPWGFGRSCRSMQDRDTGPLDSVPILAPGPLQSPHGASEANVRSIETKILLTRNLKGPILVSESRKEGKSEEPREGRHGQDQDS